MTSRTLAPTPLAGSASSRTTDRIGAALGIAGVVLIAAGFSLAAPVEATVHAPESDLLEFYGGAGLNSTMAGGLIEALGIMLFLPFAAMLASRLSAPGAPADLLAPTARMAATVYVAVAVAPGMSGGATALWEAQQRSADVGIVTALNDLRSFSYFLALLAFAMFLVAVGAAGATTRHLPRWASWSAVGLGVVLACTLAVPVEGLTDAVGLLGLAWIVAVSVAVLRRPAIERPAPLA